VIGLRLLRIDGSTPAASTVRRYREAVAVLARHGLGDVADTLRLSRFLPWRARRRAGRIRADGLLTRPERFRLALEEMGPTFVKFGQALSVRTDILPPEYAAELARLQDQVAPLPAGEAEAAIERELKRPIARLFRSFECAPMAAASIAQVHRAELPNGDAVAVKVRRPGIEPIIGADIDMLRQLAPLVERYVPALDIIRPQDFIDEFARTLRAELDLTREARNVERCAANFTGDPTVRLPRIDWERTSPAVLTMERLEGIRLSEIDAAGLGPFARRLIARRGADAMLTQVLAHGFFHADPHPGNILVLDDYVLGFIDWGIAGYVDERMRRDLSRIVRAVVRRDTAELAALAIEIAEPRGDVDARALERDLIVLVDTYGHVPLGDLRAADVLTDAVRTAARHRLRVPSNLMLLIKALVTIEGVGRHLDPGFKVIEHAAPLAERLWLREYAPDALGRRAIEAIEETVHAVRQVPLHVEAIARKARDGRLEIRFVHRNLEHFVGEMDRSSNRIAFAMIIAALIIGSSLIIHAGRGESAYGYPVLGLIGFVIAGVFGIRLATGIVRSGKL
jgi:ubiquinone biosynthesis protein